MAAAAAAAALGYGTAESSRSSGIVSGLVTAAAAVRSVERVVLAQPQVVAHSVGGGRSGSHTIEGGTLRDGEREQQPPLLRQSPVGVAQLVHGLHCLHSALAEKLQRVAPSEVLVESVACW